MQAAQAFGFAAFLAHTDAVGKAILLILLAMSLASWFVIAAKAVAWLRGRREPFLRLERSARDARAQGGEERVQRALRRAIAEDGARLESGLTLLGSIGSTAPFIGLLG